MHDTFTIDGLEWQETPTGLSLTWDQAVACAAKAGDGWRLPGRYELAALSQVIDETRWSGWYWSDECMSGGDPELPCAWGVQLEPRGYSTPEVHSTRRRGGVWLVRGEEIESADEE